MALFVSSEYQYACILSIHANSSREVVLQDSNSAYVQRISPVMAQHEGTSHLEEAMCSVKHWHLPQSSDWHVCFAE